MNQAVERKVIYTDDSSVRGKWLRVVIVSEVNCDEYHIDTVIEVAEPIVSVTIERIG